MDNKNNKKILEALQMQPLSQEEKNARHILGRLYGPIATCVESTRNGRFYNKPLWEKALADDIFLEKVATKALFLELGHPADREETDMKQTCACIPEVPKIVDNDLYAYVDILDTPNGRLLKTLVDYGFVPGISSRGSGDVLNNSQVDPETFFLETWDIVQLPAVKKARLNVCEALDADTIKLKKALVESYNAARDEDKPTMKKALENLNIDIDSEVASDAQRKNGPLTAEDIPWAPDEEVLLENSDDVEDTAETDAAEITVEPVEVEQNTTEESAEDDSDDSNDSDDTIEDVSKQEIVDNVRALLDEYEDEIDLDFEPIKINDDTYEVADFTVTTDDDGIITIGVNCESADDETADETATYTAEENDDESSQNDDSAEAANDDNSADDAGDDEVIESLKEMIRSKEALETEVRSLRNEKAVSDAEANNLREQLNRYKLAFRNICAEASKVPELKSEISTLIEQLNTSKKEVSTLNEQLKTAKQLNEDVRFDNRKLTKLTEQVQSLKDENAALQASKQAITERYNQKLTERTNLAKAYKAKVLEVLNGYIKSKADMLGVSTTEITSRLSENYSLVEVDKVCNQILESSVNLNRLPFGMRTSARISESVSRTALNNTKQSAEFGYDIDDSLLELAGLK